MRIGIANHQNNSELRRLLLSVQGYEIAWVVHDGAEAVSRCEKDTPDLLLLNLVLPIIDAVEATRRIMHHSPCPILIMASSVETNAGKIFEAMGQGAKDVISLPLAGDGSQLQHNRTAFLKKIRTLATLHGPTVRSLELKRPAPAKRMTPPPDSTVARAPRPLATLHYQPPRLLVLGASTGGPGALAKILSTLPADFNAAVVVVQHVDQEFSFDLAAWLDSQTPLNVHLARNGELPAAGCVYVASSNDHLILTAGLKFSYTPEPRNLPYRPSVDVFFNSVAQYWPQPETAVLLTGMGRDGATGLATLRRKGWYTIAQDQATSVVYGMPKAAKELNAAVDILPLEQISTAVRIRQPSNNNRGQ